MSSLLPPDHLLSIPLPLHSLLLSLTPCPSISQLAVSYTRNMRTLYGLIASLQEQKTAVQRDLAVVSHSVCWSVTDVYAHTYIHTYVHELMTECSPSWL